MRARRARLWVLAALCVAVGVFVPGGVAFAAAPTVGEESVVGVTAESATLQGQIDPEGGETAYRFEYGASEAYGSSAPAPQGAVGAGTSAVAVEAHLQGLATSTTYHYRVVAIQGAETVDGPDQTFTTQGLGGSLVLPDGRQWELVSPASMDGAQVLGIGGAPNPGAGGATQAAENGESVTYIADAPVSEDAPSNTYGTQLFSRRGPEGWSTQDISTPRASATGTLVGEGEEYRVFSQDLSLGLLWQPYQSQMPSLAPEVHEETNTNEIYLRNNADGTFRALLTAEPLPPEEADTLPVGATPDLSHILFGSKAALTPGAKKVSGFYSNLYEWSAGQLQLVSILPNGEQASGVSLGDENSQDIRNAVSADGTQVVFTGGGKLYTRNMLTGKTVEADAVQGGSGGSGEGYFQMASADGSRVFFIDEEPLTSDANGWENLYMFDTEADKLADLTPDPSEAHGARVKAVLGGNEAGTSLYVVALGVLTSTPNAGGQVAVAGERNLYLLREEAGGAWGATFIATLSGVDAAGIGNGSYGSSLAYEAARVTASGRFLAFMSDRSLTGYDNRDAVSGQPDEEVYLYDAQSNRLVCASCNPTGARPVGEYDAGGLPASPMDPYSTWQGDWLAAAIPGWTPTQLEQALYSSRVLSENGRLFFDSADALVPQDVDGQDDVYEYEPDGVGSCVNAAGCVSLISGGTGSEASSFLDASASGNDVFFTSRDELVAADRGSAVELYDAHVCTGAAPCYPPAVVAPPACTTADSCRVAAPPGPAIYGAPPSATFAGVGNVVPGSPASSVKPKHKPKKKAKKKHHKAKRAGHKRASGTRLRGRGGRRALLSSAGRRGRDS